MAHIRSCLWSLRCQSYLPSAVCRLAFRASNKLSRTGPCASRRHYACVYPRGPAQDRVKCKQAACTHARVVSPIIGVITCKQLVYPVIMDLPARARLMNSYARLGTSWIHPCLILLQGSSLFLSSYPFSSLLGRTVLLSRVDDSFRDRLSCLLFDWKFIGIAY